MLRLANYLSNPLLKGMYDLIRKTGSVRPISLDITSKCNLRCTGCYYFEEGMDQVPARLITTVMIHAHFSTTPWRPGMPTKLNPWWRSATTTATGCYLIITVMFLNQVVTTGRLNDQVWGYDVCSDLTADNPVNSDRIRNGNPYNRHFRAINADFQSKRRLPTGCLRCSLSTWSTGWWTMRQDLITCTGCRLPEFQP
jgi:hypothetical protein